MIDQLVQHVKNHANEWGDNGGCRLYLHRITTTVMPGRALDDFDSWRICKDAFWLADLMRVAMWGDSMA